MVQDGVFQIVNKNEIIFCRQKAITSTWTVKKILDRRYWAHLVTRCFQQQEGLNYSIVAISSQVTSNNSIYMVFTNKTITGYKARVIRVKASLSKGN